MSQLSDYSIEKLCQDSKWFGLRKQQPMLVPFHAEKIVVNGKSHGLSCASYDVCIGHDLVLGTIMDTVLHRFHNEGLEHPGIEKPAPYFALANTIEDFHMPKNVSASVADKSSYARLFVSAFNTFIDPGFQGNLTLELVNLGDRPVHIRAGDPICQIIFNWVDRKSRGYSGKYQGQEKRPVGLRQEYYDGSFEESDYGKQKSEIGKTHKPGQSRLTTKG